MNFFKILKEYASLKEMRSVWLFLVLALVQVVVAWMKLPSVFAYAITIANGAFLVLLVFNSINLAKVSFELKLGKRQTSAIISGFSEGVIAYDQNFRIWSFNQAAENLTSLRREEILGQVVTPEWASNPHYRLLAQILFPSLAPNVSRRAGTEYPQVVEINLTEPRQLHLEITTNQIFDEKGALMGFLKVVRDRSREVELLKLKTEFVTVAAHQLRTPLASIRWASETLFDGTLGKLNDQQAETMKQINHVIEKLVKMVDELLDLAKIEEGRYGYQFEKSDLVTLVRETLEEEEAAAKEHGVKLIFEPPTDGIPLLVIDPQRLRLAMQNLLENAIKYNIQNGEVRVKLEKLLDKPYIQVSVSDTGVGIPTQDIPKLFTKFFRGENVMRIETEGSGLGLFIARNIVKRHGGDIWVKSIEKRGTTFYFTVPTDPSLIPKVEVTAEESF